MRKWRPIETAPRSGTTVLTLHKNDLYPVAAFMTPDGVWMRETEGPEDVKGPGKWEQLYRVPTWWMPLPSPPGIRSHTVRNKTEQVRDDND